MQSFHDIKKRIVSVRETGQITKAMQLISVAKMRKANEKYEMNARYFERIFATIKDIVKHSDGVTHPYIVPRQTDRAAFIVIASDTGMTGEYNHRVLDCALKHIEAEKPERIYTIGCMARDFMNARKIACDDRFVAYGQDPNLSVARRITMYLVDLFDNDEIDRVEIIYTRKTDNGNKATALRVLPFIISDYDWVTTESEYSDRLDFEPSPKEVFDILMPQCLLGIIYSALIQSVRCEQMERMAAMGQASDNAAKMLEKLELEFNRARQASITTEIAEISAAQINSKK